VLKPVFDIETRLHLACLLVYKNWPYPANYSNLKSAHKVLIGWKKAGPPQEVTSALNM